ncbi:MAG: response regulator transcription factor [Chloroflexota bacterium]
MMAKIAKGNIMIEEYKILIVEDKKQAIEMLRVHLEGEPFQISVAYDGLAGETQFKRVAPHLVILDISLPKLNGLDLCRKIRRESNVPILMVTAKTQDVDKAIALGLGADDYLAKPYSPIELLARIKALLRRAYEYQEAETTAAALGGPRLLLNPANHRVTLDDQEISLSPIEYEVLYVLISNPGWVFTRSHLLEKVWGYNTDNGEETVTVHVSNLRQKLGKDGSELIRTVRAVGYLYEENR